MRVRDAIQMPGLVVTRESSSTLASALVLMKAKSVQHVVVKDGDLILGVLSLQDIFERGCCVLENQGMVLNTALKVGDIMTRVAGIDDAMSCQDALALMEQYQCTALPVVSHADGLIAIVSKADLAQVLREPSAREAAFDEAGRAGMVGMANPIVQQAMFLLGEAGI